MEGTNVSYFLNGAAFMFFAYAGFRLLTKKLRSRIQTILGLTLAFWALLELKDLFLCFPSVQTDHLTNMLLFFDGWAVAACSFYLLELIAPGWINMKKVGVLLLPFAAFTFSYLCTYHSAIVDAYLIFIMLYSIAIVFIVTFAARRYQRYIRNNYSYPDQIDVSWLKKATVILAICLLTWVYINIYISGWGDAMYYLLSVILWLVIFYYSEYQISIPMPNNLKGNLLMSELKEEASQETLPDTFSSFAKLLLKAMEEDELYLNPKLTIADLADYIGTNRTYLSNYFNSTLNTTFYDYINNYRIERTSKQLLSVRPLTITIDQVAEYSGFNSPSTFRRAFQKNTGMTPLQFNKTIGK